MLYKQIHEKKSLYISLVRSQILYASPVWRPHLLGDIYKIERVQKRATKYILSDYVSDYQVKITDPGHAPINVTTDIISSLKAPSGHFNILEFISFSENKTRSGSRKKMVHSRSRITTHTQFLMRMFGLLGNKQTFSTI